MTEKTTNPPLYQRLGGYDVIAGFVDETYRMLRNDPMFSRFASIPSNVHGSCSSIRYATWPADLAFTSDAT
jgi:hypothetical protein